MKSLIASEFFFPLLVILRLLRRRYGAGRFNELMVYSAPTYKDLRANNTLCSLYVDEMAHLGQAIKLIEDKPSTASTDMGNISYHCPTFHGGFAVACKDDKVGCHHPDFAEAAGTDAAHDAAIEVGKGMAMLGLRVLLDKSVSRDAWRDFKEE